MLNEIEKNKTAEIVLRKVFDAAIEIPEDAATSLNVVLHKDNERLWNILYSYFVEGISMQSIGPSLGISDSRVAMLRNKCLRSIRGRFPSTCEGNTVKLLRRSEIKGNGNLISWYPVESRLVSVAYYAGIKSVEDLTCKSRKSLLKRGISEKSLNELYRIFGVSEGSDSDSEAYSKILKSIFGEGVNIPSDAEITLTKIFKNNRDEFGAILSKFRNDWTIAQLSENLGIPHKLAASRYGKARRVILSNYPYDIVRNKYWLKEGKNGGPHREEVKWLDWSSRIKNALLRNGIQYIDQLEDMDAERLSRSRGITRETAERVIDYAKRSKQNY